MADPLWMSDEHPEVTMFEAVSRSDWLQGVVVHRPANWMSTPSNAMSRRDEE